MCETFPNRAMGDIPINNDCWICSYFRYAPHKTIDGFEIERHYDGYCGNENDRHVKGRDTCPGFKPKY